MDLKMHLGAMASVAVIALTIAGAAHATQIDLSPYVNANISDYYNGSVYPADGGEQTIGGVSFDFAAYPGGGTGAIQAADGNPDVFGIPVDQYGVTTVYSVINSAFGVAPYTIGALTFNGSAGSSFTYELTEGDNVRDHATTYYNDVAPNIFASKDYGDGDHLDVQKIVLPAEFANQYLVDIGFTAVDAGDGYPFLVGLTTSTVSAAPEPGTWALMMGGLAMIGGMLRIAKARRRENDVAGITAA